MSIVKKFEWKKMKRPIAVLAPMAGYTDSAFRQLCREMGADVVVTEMVSADAVAHAKIKNQKSSVSAGPSPDGKIKINENYLIYNKVIARKNSATAQLLSFCETERPLVVQLFGKYPEKFAKAAKWVSEELKPDGIDINMGCPARKVVGSDHGAALLKNPDLAVEIVKAVKENINLELSVKTRLGWENDGEILEFGPKLVRAGIDAIIVHGRTYKDGFKGSARWENIYKLKEIVGDKIIVIGNGDLKEVPSSKSQAPGSKPPLDGFAIGRAAFGKPWIFQNDKKISSVSAGASPDGNIELKSTILRHAKLVYESKGERGLLEFRKHLLLYLKGFPGAKTLRNKAVCALQISDIEAILAEL